MTDIILFTSFSTSTSNIQFSYMRQTTNISVNKTKNYETVEKGIYV